MFIFHNVLTSPVTIFSLYANVYKHVYGDFIKDENEKASTKTPFVVKQRQDEVTDLEKCCITTTSGAFPSTEKKKTTSAPAYQDLSSNFTVIHVLIVAQCTARTESHNS